MAAARELARCKLDLVGVQGVRWDIGGAGDYNFDVITSFFSGYIVRVGRVRTGIAQV